MAEKVFLSKQFSLKLRDFLKGAIMAIGTPLLYMVQECIPGWDADPFVKAGLSAFVTYLIKNYIERPQVITTYNSNAKAENVAEEIKNG